MDETLERDIDLTAARNPDAAPVAMLLADLGRWLTDLDERLTRLEANTAAKAFPLGSRLADAHGQSSSHVMTPQHTPGRVSPYAEGL